MVHLVRLLEMELPFRFSNDYAKSTAKHKTAIRDGHVLAQGIIVKVSRPQGITTVSLKA